MNVLSYYEATESLREQYHLPEPLVFFQHKTLLSQLNQLLEPILLQCGLSTSQQKDVLSGLNILLLDYFEQTMIEYQLTLSHPSTRQTHAHVFLSSYPILIEQTARAVEHIVQLSLLGHPILDQMGRSFETMLGSAARKIIHDYLQSFDSALIEDSLLSKGSQDTTIVMEGRHANRPV